MDITLTKEIEVRGSKVTSLTLREPTGADCIDCGMPYEIEVTKRGQRMHVDTKSVGALIEKLANIPNNSVRQMSALDFSTATAHIQSFFSPPAESQKKS